MSKTGTQSRRQRRQKRLNWKLLLSLFSLLFILSGLLLSHWLFVFRVTKSYSTSATASIANNTVVYASHFSLNSKKLQAQTVSVKNYQLTKRQGKRVLLAKITASDKTYFVKADSLTLNQTNTINQYVAQVGYPKVKVKSKDEGFSQSSYKTASGNPKGIVIHDTGTEDSTIAADVSYMKSSYEETGVFVHTFIDSSQILNIANVGQMAQGAGAKANPYYIQFEMTHVYTQADFANQLANAAYYSALMLKTYHLPVTKGQKDGSGTVWTHEMVSLYLGGTDHVDPTDYWSSTAKQLFGVDYDVDDFIELIQAYYNSL